MVILLLLWRAEGYHQSAVGHLSPFIYECRTYYLNSRILESLPNVMANIYSTLEDDGFLIISNAFAREQRYGTEFIDHFHGAAHFFSKLDGFKLIHACFYNDNEEHDDAHFLLKKCS